MCKSEKLKIFEAKITTRKLNSSQLVKNSSPEMVDHGEKDYKKAGDLILGTSGGNFSRKIKEK